MKPAHLLMMAILLSVSACSSMTEEKLSQANQIDYDSVVPAKQKMADGSIYSASQSGLFVGDRRARNVGDVLTINLVETMQATKSNDGTITRKGSLAVSLPSAIFGKGAINPGNIANPGAFGTTTDQSFAGTGVADQSNSITGKVTVMVTRVYENGNMWVQGEKKLTLNQGEEYVRVAGLVRPEDIQTGNIVNSTSIAQATISYTGSGDIADATKQNWFGRFFNYISPI
jgi:flagellar L-ring protein precursor FlgH